MEYLTDYATYSKDNFNEQEVIKLGKDICSALEKIQEHNIIHRDIKPSNILRDSKGKYKLGDFGISKKMTKDAELTIGFAHGFKIGRGTPLYMSPEIWFRCVILEDDKKVDMYSLGLSMYVMMNGTIPFLEKQPNEQLTDPMIRQAILARVEGKEILPLPPEKCSKGLNDVILKACECNRDERYADVTEMREALEALERGNAAGNLANDGLVAQQGDWLYYSDSGRLYKIRADGGDTIKLNDDDSCYINVVGDWVYYRNGRQR